ncbi:16S rRNA (cytidine(1402)-2'-O)-methyltransferase [Orrella daihaiensis]|uniref:Ribosomal RNA small subunit methyltransferase I n=1 Tax=Orrella daihaiensis TaxID=2782176 RepID=A0ABY4AK55_9BURK|nr:16S rRNA (cytidine(1402)-2'-O)-methyltransferase [Orrella daihaiensis]UOD50654.1 16S rRNA (cytidine(1402)-2'-O)-methyltransferase [Orrella daihaiensis]
MSETHPSDGLMPPWQDLLDRLAQQHWPKPALFVVATPIGNLTDLSLRAWYTLRLADVIAAEDTRTSQALLQAWHIDTPLMSAHRHNERAATAAILQRLAAGERIALISDAGAPAVSDPGGQLVRDVREAGFDVVAIPGASAVITALMATGVTTDAQPTFAFLGFLPARQAARERALKRWLGSDTSLLMYEAPHRIGDLLRDLSDVFGAARTVSLARELTKRFEETVTVPLADAGNWITANRHREQGEYVVLLHAPPAGATNSDESEDDLLWQSPERQAWMSALLAGLSTRDAAKIMAKALGVAKDVCYARLLAHSGQRDARSDTE